MPRGIQLNGIMTGKGIHGVGQLQLSGREMNTSYIDRTGNSMNTFDVLMYAGTASIDEIENVLC